METTATLFDSPNLGIDPNSTANKWDIATDQAGEMFYDGVALLALLLLLYKMKLLQLYLIVLILE